MWRYLVGGLAALLMVGAGVLLFGRARSVSPLPPAPQLTASGAGIAQQADAPLPATVPEASERTREQKRFDRYDKDRDDKVTREEYLQQRRKAFAKLDANHDGSLSFDEWRVKAETKFAAAEAEKSGALTRAEFATTAVKRKPPRRAANCPPVAAQPEVKEGEGD